MRSSAFHFSPAFADLAGASEELTRSTHHESARSPIIVKSHFIRLRDVRGGTPAGTLLVWVGKLLTPTRISGTRPDSTRLVPIRPVL